MTKIINAERAVELLRAERDRRGKSYAYTDHHAHCYYQVPANDDDTEVEPGCIAGGALINGLGLNFKDQYNYNIEGPFEGGTVTQIELANDVKFTDRAVLLIRAAQAAQDSGATHGIAVAVADHILNAFLYSDLGSSDEVE
jgi:hypothetical protein